MNFGVLQSRTALLALSILLLSTSAASAAGLTELDKICKRFTGYDQNRDRQIEIASIRPIVQSTRSGPRVLMLVEDRLLQKQPGAEDLHPYLERWAADLEAEGCRAEVVSVALAKSKIHQDGRYVLALREFLRAVNGESRLTAVVLVGHFPDASLVMYINRRNKRDVTFRKNTPLAKKYPEGTRVLERKPSWTSPKADIVLADLFGNWEKVYVQPKTSLPSITAVYDKKIPPTGGPCIDMEEKTVEYEDFFHIADGVLRIRKLPAKKDGESPAVLTIDDSVKSHECSSDDKRAPNPLAVPDILVSRIDARGVAINPRPVPVGPQRTTLLDSSGKPQMVNFPRGQKVPNPNEDIWMPDERFERKLLAEYFDRNHNYRTGNAKIAWRPSSIAYELRSGYRNMLLAAKDWEKSDSKLANVDGETTLVDFIDWMEYPAVLRTVRAHSFPFGSKFHKTDYQKIEQRVNGPIWAWVKKGNKLVPSLAGTSAGGMLNWNLLRTLYENGLVAPEPSFYHHIGCNIVTPPGVEKYAYDDPRYGRLQAAESLLFFGNGLALVGRAKVYNDEPRGFTQELAKGRTFGQAWAKYYQVESQDPNIHPVSRKRAYYWSVLGDCTLRLSTANPRNQSLQTSR